MKKLLMILGFSGSLFAAGGGSSVGTGSPASIMCKNKGGAPTILYDAGMGSANGLCVFGQGGINEWTLYRHVGGQHQRAVEEFMNPSPADCQTRGGEVKRYQSLKKQPIETCYFPADRSEIELNTLFGGPQSYPQLARVLQ